MTWDRLGRLTPVKDGAGATVLATITYDPLDRLRTVDYGGGNRIRFRYVGLTTSAAQWLDDVAGTVTRSIGTGWTGERLLDWTGQAPTSASTAPTPTTMSPGWPQHRDRGSGSPLRPAGATPRATVPSGYTPFRFQGSWHDATTDLAWVVTRWYAESLGRFVSEDTLLGEPREPDSRHLYAYAAGEPVGAWDPDGRRWFRDYDDHDQTFWAETLTALCIGLSIFAVPVSAGTAAAAAAAFCLGQSFIALIAPRTILSCGHSSTSLSMEGESRDFGFVVEDEIHQVLG